MTSSTQLARSAAAMLAVGVSPRYTGATWRPAAEQRFRGAHIENFSSAGCGGTKEPLRGWKPLTPCPAGSRPRLKPHWRIRA